MTSTTTATMTADGEERLSVTDPMMELDGVLLTRSQYVFAINPDGPIKFAHDRMFSGTPAKYPTPFSSEHLKERLHLEYIAELTEVVHRYRVGTDSIKLSTKMSQDDATVVILGYLGFIEEWGVTPSGAGRPYDTPSGLKRYLAPGEVARIVAKVTKRNGYRWAAS